MKVLEDKRFDYDGFGRLVRKRIGAHTEQHFRYDAQHRMTQAAVVRAGKNGEPVSQVFRYRYDALGRRIAKADAFGETTFVWEGLRLLQERRGAQCSSYVYEPGSYAPLARIDGHGALEAEHPASALALGAGDGDPVRGKEDSVPTTNGEWADAHHVVAGPVGGLARKLAELDRAQAAQPQPGVMENNPPTPALEEVKVNERSAAPGARIYYFHTQGNGLPEEMSDRNGNLVWRAQYRAWGSAVAEEWQAFDAVGRPIEAPVVESWARASQQTAAAPQNLRMQGQYLDRETGLHYNTFRYYDPDLGAFTTPDPIGLAGGMNLHQYGTNPVVWIEPSGLTCTKAFAKRDGIAGRWVNTLTGKKPSQVDAFLRKKGIRPALIRLVLMLHRIQGIHEPIKMAAWMYSIITPVVQVPFTSLITGRCIETVRSKEESGTESLVNTIRSKIVPYMLMVS